MARSAAFLALAALAAGTAAAAAEPKVVLPDWVRQPTPEEIWWAYPPEAMKRQIEGRALISCTVDEAGDPQLCVIQSEDPPGMGFGEAAVSLRTRMKFRPKTIDGKYAPDDVQIPIRFTVESPPAAAPPVTPRQVEVAKRIVAALKLDASTAEQLEQGLQNFLYVSGAFDAEERRIIADSMQAGVAGIRPKLADALATDLAAGLTEAELAGATAQLESPEAAKILARVMVLARSEGPALDAVIAARTKEVGDRISGRSQTLCNKVRLQLNAMANWAKPRTP